MDLLIDELDEAAPALASASQAPAATPAATSAEAAAGNANAQASEAAPGDANARASEAAAGDANATASAAGEPPVAVKAEAASIATFDLTADPEDVRAAVASAQERDPALWSACCMCRVELPPSAYAPLPCRHAVHPACLEQWRRRKTGCPVCGGSGGTPSPPPPPVPQVPPGVCAACAKGAPGADEPALACGHRAHLLCAARGVNGLTCVHCRTRRDVATPREQLAQAAAARREAAAREQPLLEAAQRSHEAERRRLLGEAEAELAALRRRLRERQAADVAALRRVRARLRNAAAAERALDKRARRA